MQHKKDVKNRQSKTPLYLKLKFWVFVKNTFLYNTDFGKVRFVELSEILELLKTWDFWEMF